MKKTVEQRLWRIDGHFEILSGCPEEGFELACELIVVDLQLLVLEPFLCKFVAHGRQALALLPQISWRCGSGGALPELFDCVPEVLV
jgi:hypothetical protein